MSEVHQHHFASEDLKKEVHVWYTTIEPELSENRQSELFEILSDDEKSQANRFHFNQDRCQYLLAHALLRTCLSRYYDLEPSGWIMAATEKGKPFISNNVSPKPQINLTHTRGLTACVITHDQTCGIDVEMTHRVNEHDQLFETVCSAEELRVLSNCSDKQQRRKIFYQYWVLKEAYIKAIGEGLAFGVERLTFRVDSKDIVCLVDGVKLENWQFELFFPNDNVVLATAVHMMQEKRKRVRYMGILSFDEWF